MTCHCVACGQPSGRPHKDGCKLGHRRPKMPGGLQPLHTPRLVATLHEIRAGFLAIREPGLKLAPEFYLNMLDQQVIEAREHLAAGRPDKALAEVADCFSVGWQAIADAGVDPEAFIEERLRTRVLARVRELHDRDVVAGRTGYKPGVRL